MEKCIIPTERRVIQIEDRIKLLEGIIEEAVKKAEIDPEMIKEIIAGDKQEMDN